jgi:glycosyltransferase involved in cell wall biosynthesis
VFKFAPKRDNEPLKVCVVGSGTKFLSGISYYTHRLATALEQSHKVSVILMRGLLPTAFYPGKKRVGANLTNVSYSPQTPVFNGVDWFWLPSIFQALFFLWKNRPDVIVFQWWTGTVAHSYVFLALVARLLGAKVIIEFHEVQDTGELKIPFAATYVNLVAPLLVKLAAGFIIHSEFDRPFLEERYKIQNRSVAVIPHGPYDHYRAEQTEREAPSDCVNLLFFGTIRPYKGLEDLVRAFDAIPENEIKHYWLTVVGETWEGWTLPDELIARSRYRDRITFVNRYVTDAEVAAFYAGADAVVLPYHRSSASGPLHVTMNHGLPVIVTRVGGLIEAAEAYAGAILVPPQDSEAIKNAIRQVKAMKGQRFEDVHSWANNAARYTALFEQITGQVTPVTPLEISYKISPETEKESVA